MKTNLLFLLLVLSIGLLATSCSQGGVGVGQKAPAGAEVLFDGSRESLDGNWIYWEGPRFAAEMPIKWKIVDDPVDAGSAMNSNDPAAAGGKYGSADIVTKNKYRDFRLHVEFLIEHEGGNSGVYLQNRYEIQVLDGDSSKHGLGAVINETESPITFTMGSDNGMLMISYSEQPGLKMVSALKKPWFRYILMGSKPIQMSGSTRSGAVLIPGLTVETMKVRVLQIRPAGSSYRPRDTRSFTGISGSKNWNWKLGIRIFRGEDILEGR